MDLRYILYGLLAVADDPIDPQEVFLSPDPDGEPRNYMFVWQHREMGEAFIRHQGALGSIFVRPVRLDRLCSFAKEHGAWFAVDPDQYGATTKLAEPFAITLEVS